ncbi:MAG: hypothetical protein WCJ62_09565 [Flavobacterium sp.]
MNDYEKFVVENLNKFSEYSNFGKQEISPWEINMALGAYHEVSVTLLSEYQKAKYILNQVKRNFTVWYDEKYLEARKELNNPNDPASKWASTKEIDSHTRVKNKEEWLSKTEQVEEQEQRVSFLSGLRDSWKAFDSMLVNLSQNSRSEMKALSIQDRMHSDIRKRVRLEG